MDKELREKIASSLYAWHFQYKQIAMETWELEKKNFPRNASEYYAYADIASALIQQASTPNWITEYVKELRRHAQTIKDNYRMQLVPESDIGYRMALSEVADYLESNNLSKPVPAEAELTDEEAIEAYGNARDKFEQRYPESFDADAHNAGLMGVAQAATAKCHAFKQAEVQHIRKVHEEALKAAIDDVHTQIEKAVIAGRKKLGEWLDAWYEKEERSKGLRDLIRRLKAGKSPEGG